MNSRNYRKLPRHYIPQNKFHIQLTHDQSQTLIKLLPKGCILFLDNKNVIKQQTIKEDIKNVNQRSMNKLINNKETSLNNNSKNSKNIVNNNNNINNKKAAKTKQKQKQHPSILTLPLQQQKTCLKLLQQLKSCQYSYPFLQPVDAINLGIPQYFQIIKQPMDLQTVQKKLKQKKYKQIKQFYLDINRIIQNSYKFNQGNVDFIKITNSFEKYFYKIAGQQVKNMIIQIKNIQKIKQKQEEKLNKKIMKEKQKEKQLKEKQKLKELKQKEKAKQKQLRQKERQKQKQNLLLHNNVSTNKHLKKKKKGLSKDMLQAQNISIQQKLQLAKNIHSLPKQHIKGIRNIVFDHKLQQQQHINQTTLINQQQFDIQRIGYKKIRQLQKYVKNKLIQVEQKQNQQIKKVQINLDQMDSQWTEQFVE